MSCRHLDGRLVSERRTHSTATGHSPIDANAHNAPLLELLEPAVLLAHCANKLAANHVSRLLRGSNRVLSETACKRFSFSCLERGICGGPQPTVFGVLLDGRLIRHHGPQMIPCQTLTAYSKPTPARAGASLSANDLASGDLLNTARQVQTDMAGNDCGGRLLRLCFLRA